MLRRVPPLIAVSLCAFLLFLPSLARASAISPRQPQAADAASTLRSIVAAGKLEDLRCPVFSDSRPALQAFYEPAGYQFAWLRNSQPTPQALAVIEALKTANLQ